MLIRQEVMGKWSTPVANDVEKGAVRKFAEAIGDANPLYVDEAYAKTTRHGRLVAPPTFSRTFDFGVVEGFELSFEGMIHGEQQFHFERPLYVGETIQCSYRLASVNTRKGSLGRMTFLTLEEKGIDAKGEPVFLNQSTVIVTEGGEA